MTSLFYTTSPFTRTVSGWPVNRPSSSTPTTDPVLFAGTRYTEEQRDELAIAAMQALERLAEKRHTQEEPPFDVSVWRFSAAKAADVMILHVSPPAPGQEQDLTSLLQETVAVALKPLYQYYHRQAPVEEAHQPKITVKYHAPDAFETQNARLPGVSLRKDAGCCWIRKLHQEGEDAVVRDCIEEKARDGDEHRDPCGGCTVPNPEQLSEEARPYFHPRSPLLKPVNLFA